MRMLRFLAALVASFTLTPILGLIMPLVGLFIAGFAAGALSGSIAVGATAALLGSLPWHLAFAKLLQVAAGALGCRDCHSLWVVSLAGLIINGVGGAVGGAVSSKLFKKG